MKSWEEIVDIMTVRMSYDTQLQRQMISIRDRYNATCVIPVTDTPGEPDLPPLAPQVIHDGIEHTAMRAAMNNPSIFVPPVDPSKVEGAKSRDYAAVRRRALYANWHFSHYPMVRARLFRQLCGYGACAAIVVPDFEAKRARVETRDALTAYPEQRAPDDYRAPRNCGFVYGRSSEWLLRNYPEQAAVLHADQQPGVWNVIEWIDEDQIAVGVMGIREWERTTTNTDPLSSRLGMQGGVKLRAWPNRAGMVPVGAPRRVTLDRIAGQMDSLTGMADWMDRLMSLSILAAEKGVFADMYVLSDENQQATLSGDTWKDGRSGEVNILSGAKTVGQMVSGSNPMTYQMLDRLERAANRSGGVIPQFGGENEGSLRTGRAIETMGSFSIDPRIKELQEVHAAMMSESINPGILAVEKGYWPKRSYVVFSGRSSEQSHVEYTPEEHFESFENSVSYSFPGVDVSEISVGLQQLVGSKMTSRHSARMQHPMIEDPEQEERRIVEEELDEALRQALAGQVASGALPLIDYASIRKKHMDGESLIDAVLATDEEARARQASAPDALPEGALPPEEGGPVPGAAGQPGLALPGQGAEAMGPPSSMPGPTDDQQALQAMLGALQA